MLAVWAFLGGSPMVFCFLGFFELVTGLLKRSLANWIPLGENDLTGVWTGGAFRRGHAVVEVRWTIRPKK
jgi:hypothetical protein